MVKVRYSTVLLLLLKQAASAFVPCGSPRLIVPGSLFFPSGLSDDMKIRCFSGSPHQASSVNEIRILQGEMAKMKGLAAKNTNAIESLKGEIVKLKNVKSGGQVDNNKVVVNELRGLKGELQSLKAEIRSTKKLQNLAWAIDNVNIGSFEMNYYNGVSSESLVRDILLSFRAGVGHDLAAWDNYMGKARHDYLISYIHLLIGSKRSIRLEKCGKYTIYHE